MIKSFRFLFTLLSSLFLVLILLVSVLFFYGQAKNSIEHELNRYIQKEEMRISSLVTYPLWKYDYKGVEAVCLNSLENPRIESVLILDESGETVFSNSSDHSLDGLTVRRSLIYEGSDIGEMVLVFDQSELTDLRRGFLWRALLFIAFITSVTVFMIPRLLRIMIIKPQNELVAALGSIQTRTEKWVYKGSLYREFLPLITSVEALSEELANNKENLKINNLKLEETNSKLRDEISSNLKYQEMIRISEERYKLALEFSRDGIFDWNLISNEIYYSPEWKKLLGYEDDELPNDFSVWENLTDPADVKRSWKMQQEMIAKERDRFVLEFRMRHKDGHWVDILSRAKAVFDQNGSAVRIVGTHTDITERKAFENELKLKNAAIDNSLNGFDIVDENNKIVYVNKAFAAMYGFESPEDMIGIDPTVLCQDPRIPELIISTLKEKGAFISEFKAKRKDGSLFDILMYARLATDQAGKEIYPTTSIDISQRKKAEEENRRLEDELVQAHKMEAIGTLAGGIAHDFNNILSSILGYSELSLNQLNQGDLLYNFIEEIMNAGLRAKDLVNQILTFARKKTEALSPFQPKPIISEVLKFLRSSIPVTIDIKSRLESESYIMGNATQLHQILLNLCSNASDAMKEGGGTLEVCLSDVSHDEALPGGLESRDLGFLKISVIDTGEGIDPEILESIFQPYFTTKKTGEGTGMGLALVHGIVQSYGGAITVDSSPGKGSTFSVYLPTVERTYFTWEPDHSEEEKKGTESLLLVDDEPGITGFISDGLSKLGYHMTVTNSSKEALALFIKAPANYDLIITDLTMPEMTGKDLAREIVRIRSDIPIILNSGFIQNDSAEERLAEFGIRRILEKPVSLLQIARAVRDILDS